MISTVLAMLVMAPPQSTDALAFARKDYMSCLSGFMKKSLKEKAEEAAFETGLAPACTAQEQKFRAALIAVDTASGVRRAAAEQGAGMEVEDMVTNIKERFKDYKATNTAPSGA
jgi:hypothetical protein